LKSNPTEEEYRVDLLNEKDMELKMLEDWLDNLEPEDGCQETVMHISIEEHSVEFLKNFILGAKQEMTVALEPATEEEADSIDFVEM